MNIKMQAYKLHLQGLSYRQIGEQLGISSTTAFGYIKEFRPNSIYTQHRFIQLKLKPKKPTVFTTEVLRKVALATITICTVLSTIKYLLS